MFWGLNLKPNRKYTQTVSKSFHISQAALDTTSTQDGENQIFISFDNQKFLICTLDIENYKQVMLDLNFMEGNEICFQSIGSGNVSLTGYMVDPMSDDGDSDDNESMTKQDMVDLRYALNKKKNKAAAVNNNGGDDEEDSESDDEELELESNDDEDSDEDEEEDDDEEDDDDGEDDDDEDEEEEVEQPKAKQPKLEKPQKQQNGVAKETSAEKKGKQDKKNKIEGQQPQQQPKPLGMRTITGGVKVEDLRVGNGPEVKTGHRVTVFYEGRFKSNNKVFDSLKQGSGFKFSIGRGDVIKGWDVGVIGMKVGGKRRITCPPHMAYGSGGQPPVIPPNSTLVFEIELKGTK